VHISNNKLLNHDEDVIICVLIFVNLKKRFYEQTWRLPPPRNLGLWPVPQASDEALFDQTEKKLTVNALFFEFFITDFLHTYSYKPWFLLTIFLIKSRGTLNFGL
jgi:hypothetical protein